MQDRLLLPLRRISFWLMPSPSDADGLQADIDRLAGAGGKPSFSAHLTLLSPCLADEETLRSKMEAFFSQVLPLNLLATGLGHSEAFYRACVIEMEPSSELLQLRAALAAHFKMDLSAAYLPHVSLVYGGFSANHRKALLATVQAPLAIRFDRIQAIAPGQYSRDGEDYPAWEILGSWPAPLLD